MRLSLFSPRSIQLLFVVSFGFPVFANGATTQPPGLADGDRYRLIFVTSVTRDGLSHDIEDYNAFVQSVADASDLVGPLGLEWKAVASTSSVDARDNTETSVGVHELVPVYFLDGTPMFFSEAGPADMYQGDGSYPIDITENGTLVEGPKRDEFTGRPVFTGTGLNGVASVPPLGGAGVILGGDTGLGGKDGREHAALGKAGQAHFYAISGIITVPEPATLGVGVVWLFVLPSLRRKRPLVSAHHSS